MDVTEKIVPARKTSPGSGTRLDGVEISGCAFTESVGKKEPRPPLHVGRASGNVTLDTPDHRVYIELGHTPDGGEPDAWISTHGMPGPYVGYCASKSLLRLDSVPYTGPIKAAWWPLIRKWWQP